jgi:hypothetical protein
MEAEDERERDDERLVREAETIAETDPAGVARGRRRARSSF